MKEVKLPSRSSGIHAFSSIFHSPKVLLFKYLSFFVQKKKKNETWPYMIIYHGTDID